MNRIAETADEQQTPADGRSRSTQVHRAEFDDGLVLAIVDVVDGSAKGWIEFSGNGDMTSDEFRAAADLYEAFPAWLRNLAALIDARNASATEGV